MLCHHWNAYLASGIPRFWFFLIPLQPFSVFASSSSCPWFLYVGTFLLQPLTPLFFLSPCLLTLWVMSYSFLVLNAICQWTSLSSHLLRGHLVASWQAQPGCLCLGKCLKPDVSETEPLLLPAPAPAWASPGFDWQVLPFSDSGLNIWSLPWLLVLPCLTSNPLANSRALLLKSQSPSFSPLGLLDHTTRGPRLDDGCCFPSWGPVWSQQSSQEIPLKHVLSFAQSSSQASFRIRDLMVACRAQHDLASVKPVMSSYYSPHSSFNFSLPVLFAFCRTCCGSFSQGFCPGSSFACSSLLRYLLVFLPHVLEVSTQLSSSQSGLPWSPT